MTDKIKATHKIKASSMFAMALLFLLASFTLGSLSASSNALHVYDLRPGSEGTFIREIHDVNGRVMLIGYNDSSAKLYVQRDTDSFEAIFTPSENDVVNESISMNDLYFFTTYNFDSYLAKLWVSDGTSEGTNMLLESPLDGIGFNSIRNLLTINNHLYFTAIDPDLGKEVWQSDGTPEGTAVFADINPGSSSSIQASSIDQLNRPTMMSNYGSRIYVYADDGIHGYELWRIDTGSGNYELVKDINSGPDSSFPNDFYTFKGFTYFRANDGIHGFELWRTDGTSQNTTLVADINSGEGGSSPGYFNSANDMLFMAAWTPELGTELWAADGYPIEVFLVKDVVEGAGDGYFADRTTGEGESLRFRNNFLYFMGYDKNDLTVWRSDGTESGTQIATELLPIPNANPADLTLHDNRLYFSANDDEYGRELWSIPYPNATPRLEADIFEGANSSNPSRLVSIGSSLFFSANNGILGTELWQLDTYKTPQEEITSLQADVQELADNGTIPQAKASKLKGLLQTALNQIERGHTRRAGNLLARFISQIVDLNSQGYIDTATATYLMNEALFTINQLD